MLGYFFCESCGGIHDDWFHGNKLMVCEKCFSKRSVRYNELIRWKPSHPMAMIAWGIPTDMQAGIRKEVTCNPLDVRKVLRTCSGVIAEYIRTNLDVYIKFAYFNFREPEEINFKLSRCIGDDRRRSVLPDL